MEKALQNIPSHLKNYIVDQEYDQYTAIDHASWRYIMKISKEFFKENAHPLYLGGLEKTGISTERIPRISEMDEKLQNFGWRAVSITGFIPPAAFLEMLSLGLLPIACDMRKLENIEYTPSPDIVHEAAGHAPILADPEYASFLNKFGEVARKVIFAQHDCEVYEAVLDLSEIKEDPESSEEVIQSCEARLNEAYHRISYVSEAQKLTRIGWWSIEYGLIKQDNKFLIYGAGLLSSVGESYDCLGDSVKKVAFDLSCIEQDYDITKPQPQLFYSNSFKEMEGVIEEFANTLAYRHGGVAGLDKAIEANTVNTVELNSGIQIGGVLSKYRLDKEGKPVYLHFSGPTQLAFEDKKIEGHGPSYHSEGFGTPLGNLKGKSFDASLLTKQKLDDFGWEIGGKISMEFESGVTVDGVFTNFIEKNGKFLVMSFKDCLVKLEGEVLFDPKWGAFDMACGSTDIPSVFGGAADRESYLLEVGEVHSLARPQKKNLSDKNRELELIYRELRNLRESKDVSNSLSKSTATIYEKIKGKYPQDWLLRFELLELLVLYKIEPKLEKSLRIELDEFMKAYPSKTSLIKRGLSELNNK